MYSKVKEFFKELEIEEQKESRAQPKYNRRLGIRPSVDYNIPDITNFSHFVECEIAPDICPMMWETMEVDFEDKERRHCDYCDKYVYKVDNEYMLEKFTSQNECIAISNNLLEQIHDKMDEKRHDNLQLRLIISKLFMHFKKNMPFEFNEMKNRSLSHEKILEEILLFSLETSVIKSYIKSEVEIEKIYEIVLGHSENEEFKEAVFDKMNEFLKTNKELK